MTSNSGERPRGSATDYPERSPFDLIDEDKRSFARRRILATLSGGWRSTYDEVDERSIHPGLLIPQTLLFLIFPFVIGGLAIAPSENESDAILKSALAAIIASLIVCSLQAISYILDKQDVKKANAAGNPVVYDDERPALVSRKSFYFLVPSRSGLIELVAVTVLSGLYAFFMTHLVQ